MSPFEFTLFTIFTWCLTATTIYGTLLNSRQNKYGFLVWGLCNLMWLTIDFSRGIYAQAALYMVFIGFNVYGWMQWGKKVSSVEPLRAPENYCIENLTHNEMGKELIKVIRGHPEIGCAKNFHVTSWKNCIIIQVDQK